MGKIPAIQFYHGDWLRDPVSGCSLEAQGLWLRMLFLMFDSERRGYLILNGKAMSDAYVARKCGSSTEVYLALFSELSEAGVPRKTEDGITYNKRMVDDERERSAAKGRMRKKRGSVVVTPNVTRDVTDVVTPLLEDEIEVPAFAVVPEKTKVVAATFSLRGPTHAELICAEYPLKVEMAEAVMECDIALTRLANGEMGGAKMSAADAMFFLSGRVKAYARSPEGKTKFAPNPAKWFKKSRYLDDEEAWYAREAATSKTETRTANNLKAVLRSRGEDAGVRRRDVPNGDRGRANHDVEGTAE